MKNCKKKSKQTYQENWKIAKHEHAALVEHMENIEKNVWENWNYPNSIIKIGKSSKEGAEGIQETCYHLISDKIYQSWLVCKINKYKKKKEKHLH